MVAFSLTLAAQAAEQATAAAQKTAVSDPASHVHAHSHAHSKKGDQCGHHLLPSILIVMAVLILKNFRHTHRQKSDKNAFLLT